MVFLKGQTRTFFAGISIIVGILFALSGCSRFSNEPAVLWTNNEEFAAYAEIFNTSQNEYKVSVVYRENPAHALRQSDEPPDIVIGAFLNDRKTLPLFQSLEPMIEKEQLFRGDFYPEILRLGIFEEKQTLIPVSFSLPLFMFPSGYEGIDDFTLSLEEIRTLSVKFPEENPSRTVLGYSPRWNPEAAFTHLRLFNSNFRETSNGTLIWNREGLESGVDYMREWIRDVNGGWEYDTEFIDKYHYEPPYKLIASGRILFSFSYIDHYYHIPAAARDALDFRWISYEEQIPVREDIIFGGIPRSADRRVAARAFLSWFFDPLNQVTLLETSQYKRMRLFGIAGGFSSLVSVNEIEIPKYFPELIGKIAPVSFLKFPQALPDVWKDIKSKSILPWIEAQLNKTSRDHELEWAIERWLSQQPHL